MTRPITALFLLSSLMFSSCGNSPKVGKTSTEVTETWQDGSPKKTIVRDANTQKKIAEVELYDNETTFREWSYLNGLKNGTSRSFREDGKPWSLNTYVNDTLHGPYQTWHENGQLYIDGSYQKGNRSAIWKFYGPDGALIKQIDFDKQAADSLSH
jgi:antitoxin component YwqK of YwqJK toxin-antitoxin module